MKKAESEKEEITKEENNSKAKVSEKDIPKKPRVGRFSDASPRRNVPVRPNEDQSHLPASERKFTQRCRLFVGNLTNDTTEDELREMFQKYGEVSELYLNTDKAFAFVRLDLRRNAEMAKTDLDGTRRKGSTLRVRFATHGAALKVKHLSPLVSNELLERAFTQFGVVERAVVIVDDRGRSTGEGIVEFSRKVGAVSASKQINGGCFLLTSSMQPIHVEPLEQRDEEDGLPEKSINKNKVYDRERDREPRFASPGTFEYECASRWKQLYEMEQAQRQNLEKQVTDAREKLKSEMSGALQEHQAMMMRQELMRKQDELRRIEEQRNEQRKMRSMNREQGMNFGRMGNMMGGMGGGNDRMGGMRGGNAGMGGGMMPNMMSVAVS